MKRAIPYYHIVRNKYEGFGAPCKSSFGDSKMYMLGPSSHRPTPFLENHYTEVPEFGALGWERREIIPHLDY